MHYKVDSCNTGLNPDLFDVVNTQEQRLMQDKEHRSRLIDTVRSEAGMLRLLIDRDGCILSISQAAAQLFGVAPGKRRKMHLSDLASAQQLADAIETGINTAFSTATEHCCEMCVEVAGDFREIELKVQPLPDTGDNAETALVTIMDFTERNHADRRAKALESYQNQLAEALPHLVWMSDCIGTPLFFNRRWTEYTGCAFAETLERGFNSFLHLDDVGDAVRAGKEASDRGELYETQFRIRRHDGAYRWFLSRGLPVKNEDGKIEHWFGTCTDIDDQKRAEEEACRANARTNAILEGMADAFYTLDNEGCFTYVNANMADTIHLTIEDMLGRNIWDTLPEAAQMPYRHDIQKAIDERVPVHSEGYYAPQNIWYEADIYPSAHGLAVFTRDVTEHKRAEEERLRFMGQIQALNHRLQRAMSETHHRIRNNLQFISALVDIQTMENKPAIDASEIRRIGQLALSLAAVHDLLTQQAKIDADVETIGTREMLNRLLPTLSQIVGDRLFHYEIDDLQLPIRYGTSLAIIVNELISNAVQYGSGDISLQFTVDSEEAHLTVTDGGPGFPADFDPRIAAHTGMEIIESIGKWDLGGDIVYSNRPEGGAKVDVVLPIPDLEEHIF